MLQVIIFCIRYDIPAAIEIFFLIAAKKVETYVPTCIDFLIYWIQPILFMFGLIEKMTVTITGSHRRPCKDATRTAPRPSHLPADSFPEWRLLSDRRRHQTH